MTTIGLWGPRARDILSAATSDDVSNEGFKFGTCRIDRRRHGARARLADLLRRRPRAGSCTCRWSRACALWDALWEAGRPQGLAACGIGVYGTTGRLEKCYRAHGNELETEYNVVEAGMSAPRVKAEDFVGKEAHLRHREEEPAAILCTLTVDDHTSKSGEKRYMLGREPILTRDGKRLVDRKGRGSYVTSAGAGPSVGKHILMAYLPPEHAVVGDAAGGRVHGRALPGHGRGRRSDAAVRPGEPAHPLRVLSPRNRLRRDFAGAPELLVCVKRVPFTGGKMVLNADSTALETRHLGFTISPHEECGVEEAVRLIEAGGGESVVLTLGPPEAVEQLRDAMALGIDRAIHLQTDGAGVGRRGDGRRASSRRSAPTRPLRARST